MEKGNKSVTLRSYVSAIKAILRADGYELHLEAVVLNTLTQGCKLVNDKVQTRLPIQVGLLDLILFEVGRKYAGNQPYLMILYQALFAIAYYGLFCIGELALSQHSIKGKDVHVAMNKNKILMMLYSSKTHGAESRPQKVKIQARAELDEESSRLARPTRFFCPFDLMRCYIQLKGVLMMIKRSFLFLETELHCQWSEPGKH